VSKSNARLGRARPRTEVVFLGWIAIVAVAISAWIHFARLADEAALKEQLDLAHREGMSTTWQEVLDGTPVPKSEENAAPIYVALFSFPKLDIQSIDESDRTLLDKATPESIRQASEIVAAFPKQLELIDRAATLPRCQFIGRDKGPLEYFGVDSYRLSGAAKLIALRGSIAATRGDALVAVKNAEEMMAIARHIDDDGLENSRIASDAVEESAVAHLLTWRLHHLGEKTYLNAVRRALQSWEPPDLRRMFRGQIVLALTVANAILTPDGRKELGFKTDDYGLTESFLASIRSQPKGRIALVSAGRKVWRALALPISKRRPVLEEADDRIESAMDAFPTPHIEVERDPVDQWMYDQYWLAKIQLYKAALRAVSGKTVAKSIRTTDLPSPFDGKPLTFSFDGKQMLFVVSNSSGHGDGPRLKIGPDP